MWEPVKWLLEIDLRVKNAVSMVLALVSTLLIFVNLENIGWLHNNVLQNGSIAIFIVLPMVFLIMFLFVWLIWSGVAAVWHHVASQRAAITMEHELMETIRHNLSGVTEWQRQFLLRFIVEKRTQIAEFQIGGYRAAWDFELGVLLSKGIVHEHTRAGVYEFDPLYCNYLIENWDPAAGTLA